MMRHGDFYQLFLASPEFFFDELTRRLKGIDERIDRLTARIDDLAEAMETYIRQDLPILRARPDVTAWTYHALMPNAVFDSVYEPEMLPTGAKRWVNATACLQASLVLPRNHQFHVEVQVADFVSPEAEASFALTADGQKQPWLSQEGRLYKALIPAKPESRTLDFKLETDPSACVGRDVSFSFQTIRVYANQAVPKG
jgi:hypothetical protein